MEKGYIIVYATLTQYFQRYVLFLSRVTLLRRVGCGSDKDDVVANFKPPGSC